MDALVFGCLDEMRSAGGDALAVAADIANSQQVDDMMKKVVEHYGTLDILVNNAAITPGGDKSQVEAWQPPVAQSVRALVRSGKAV